MFLLHSLSESSHDLNLTWLLWLVLALFVLIILIGCWVSRRKKKENVSAHPVAEETPPAVESVSAPVAAVAEAVPAPAKEVVPDDLTLIEGIGPKVCSVLTEAGYPTFAALASADAEVLRELLRSVKLQMMEPSGWIEQAKLAAKGDMESLAKLQDELKGGRRV